jgi:hypothetical protein
MTEEERYEGRLIRPDYNTQATHALYQKRHEKQAAYLFDPTLPVGIQQALRLPLVHCQVASRYPWAVHFRRGAPTRWVRSLHHTLGGAMSFHRRALRLDPAATIVSRGRGYDIPPELRGRIPSPWKWCPHCMKPRKYRRVTPPRTFTAEVKHWSEEKQRWVWSVRSLALMKCPVCRNSNRSPIFRRSNQPWHTTRLGKHTQRVRRRRSMRTRARTSRQRRR